MERVLFPVVQRLGVVRGRRAEVSLLSQERSSEMRKHALRNTGLGQVDVDVPSVFRCHDADALAKEVESFPQRLLSRTVLGQRDAEPICYGSVDSIVLMSTVRLPYNSRNSPSGDIGIRPECQGKSLRIASDESHDGIDDQLWILQFDQTDDWRGIRLLQRAAHHAVRRAKILVHIRMFYGALSLGSTHLSISWHLEIPVWARASRCRTLSQGSGVVLTLCPSRGSE